MKLGTPSPLSILLCVIVLGQGVYAAYQSTKKTDTENYTKGAQKVETSTTTSISPVAHYYPLSFGCSPFVRMDGLNIKPEEVKEPAVRLQIPKEAKK